MTALEKLVFLFEVETLANRLREKSKKIVTTNGSFDILHEGHFYFLREAKEQGDVLIVGLNSDSSVRKNKGLGRPINNQEIRALNLTKLEYVDYVVIFYETTPNELLKKIKPHVHVNGEEYGNNCVEAPVVRQYGGRIHLVRRIEGYSTTRIIGERQ
ncbi:adenylyltransferase/cytidyltransferase family protein [Candidatus Woesearchaeota archaeon]|nr:adenylyltransferase/cytidyltransferase family protein [Candidatus Woesearchaeota archaeon]